MEDAICISSMDFWGLGFSEVLLTLLSQGCELAASEVCLLQGSPGCVMLLAGRCTHWRLCYFCSHFFLQYLSHMCLHFGSSWETAVIIRPAAIETFVASKNRDYMEEANSSLGAIFISLLSIFLK